MADSLAKLFRVSLSKGRQIISIGDEIEHVRNYLIIQSMRYIDKFDYIIDIDPDILEYRTLKLILQPLVENAIYHGIKMKKEFGTIKITGEEYDDCIIFEVSDTGKGMKTEELEKLIEHLNKEDQQESKYKSYGIRNVQQRIRIYFGNEYGLTYTSEYGEGTTVQVKIPKKLEGETYV
jgi:two-component system sensor histidine kinase YesM